MKRKIIFLVLILILSISLIAVGSTIDNSIKKIPEKAVLL